MRTDTATFHLLEGALSAAQLRQQVYANNIANADTPGYKRQDVVFESLLNQAMQPAPAAQLGVKHMQIPQPGTVNWAAAANVQPRVVTDTSSAQSTNGNNVDMTAEMTRLAQNQLRYNGLVEDMKMRFSQTKTAITG
ncbi:flagellar basal body rod protein FlgB [Alicyclobacillus sp. SO9]|uniref:flagellar basal body rod protein FlgB n=1 Tax=Alicyclobacillus sp. SO9 TaxID=2665646 RepID=UPI0018E73F41|nr:flagellar basal body rod protein FlgB [Alicyclobacillus sp. SO9]QQE80799.1 flagellar basal body rod protein FlgB [Alicyclobacillus sp. SO9]